MAYIRGDKHESKKYSFNNIYCIFSYVFTFRLGNKSTI